MKLNQAIDHAKKRHASTVRRKNENQKSKPATVSGVCRFFNFTFEECDYGVPPTITKKDNNMVSGFIRLLKNNHYTDSDIYTFIQKYIKEFESLKTQQVYTNKNKKYTIGARPNIKDLLYCRDDIRNKLRTSVVPEKKRDLIDSQLTDTERW